MHKKIVIFVAIGVGLLIIAAGVVGAIVTFNKQNQPPVNQGPETNFDADANQEEQTIPDLSIDLGACTAVSHDIISTALKPGVDEVRDAINRGFGYEANGDKSQSCVYPFSASNNFSNRFTLTVTAFKDETNKQNGLLELDNYTAVSGIGEQAAFFSSADTEVLKQSSYMLLMVKDMNLYSLTILQPIDDDVFTKETAQSSLETIAKAIE